MTDRLRGHRIGRIGYTSWAGPGVVIVALTVVFLHRAVLMGEVFSPANILYSWPPWREFYGPEFPQNETRGDDVLIFQPVLASHWKRLRAGELPQLDPFPLSGTQAFLRSLFLGFAASPLSLPYYLLPFSRAPGVEAALRIALAGTFMFAYCRGIGLLPIASLLAAIAFMLNGHFVVWLSSPLTAVAIWLPLGLLAAENLLRRPGPRSVALFALAVAPQYLGAYPPTALIGTLLIVCYALVGVAGGPRPLLRVLCLFLGSVLAGLIGTLGLLPLLTNLQGSALLHRHAAALRYDLRNLATFVFPDYWGTPLDHTWRLPLSNYCETVTYLGLAPLLLAPLALILRRDRRVWFFAGASLLVLGHLYGIAPTDWLGNLPWLKAVVSFRWVVVLPLASAVLSAFAIDALVRRTAPRAVTATAVLVLIAVLAGGYSLIAAHDWMALSSQARALILDGGLRGALLMGLVAAAICALLFTKAPSAQPAAALIVVLAVDLVNAGIRFNPTLPAIRYYPPTPALQWLQEHAGDERIAFVGDPSPGPVPGMVASLFGLHSVGGYDPLPDAEYQRFLAAALIDHDPPPPSPGYVHVQPSVDPESPILDLLRVRYIAGARDIDLLRRRTAVAVSRSDTTVGEIRGHRRVGQTFYCPAPGLSEIDVFPSTGGRPLSGRLVFHLREQTANSDLVRLEVALDRLVDGNPLALSFSPIADSGGKRFRFWVESQGDQPDDRFSLWQANEDVYDGGEMQDGDQAVGGDLHFRALVTLSEAPPTLSRRYEGDLTIIENLDAMPLAWVVHRTVLASGDDALARLRASFPIREAAVVGQAVDLSVGSPAFPRDALEVVRRKPEQIEVRLAIESPGLLVVSERFDPRWRARVDGVPAALLRANGILCGILVPAGASRVTLTYRDEVVGRSIALTALGVLLALVGLWKGDNSRGWSAPRWSRHQR